MKFPRSPAARSVFVSVAMIPAAILAFNISVLQARIPVVVEDSLLPERVGDWAGHEVPLTEAELSMLHSPAASQRVYVNTRNGDVVQVLVIQVNNTQNAHDPKLCMAGSGYGLSNHSAPEAGWVGAGQDQKVSHAVFTKDRHDINMYYWMQTRTGTIPDMSAGLKIEGIKRALRGESTKGVAIRLICLPRRGDGSATPAESATELWAELDGSVGLSKLVGRM